MSFWHELQWRGLVHQSTPGLPDWLTDEPRAAYVGFDPTADSLHLGNLVSAMLLVHWARAGHHPIALVGGATGMVGDPSGKSAERKLMDLDELRHNEQCIAQQLQHIIGTAVPQAQLMVANNYDWYADMPVLTFLREVGKHLTVNYMMAKDSVQNRLEGGLSFTEFSYQLLQAYDFLQLYRRHRCTVQMGGSDQWGNITSGLELIRRVEGAETHALVCPLMTKADGTKFGKSEQGNVWLDARRTSPYRLYQFLVNTADADVGRLLRVLSLAPQPEVEALLVQGQTNPGARAPQLALAEEITQRLHGAEGLNSARRATEALFGQGDAALLAALGPAELADLFEGLPTGTLPPDVLTEPLTLLRVLVAGGAFPSNAEAKRALQAGSVRLNKQRVQAPDMPITPESWLAGRYLLVQNGKKTYHLVQRP